MSAELNKIIPLRKDQIKKASITLARAFLDDPTSILAYPDESERKKNLPYLQEYLLRYYLSSAEVYTTSEQVEGVAIWQYREGQKVYLSVWQFLITGAIWPAFKIGLKAWRLMQPFVECTENKHLKIAPFPHWYLMGLAVDPDYQGKGYSSRLLRPMLRRMDKEGLPCYLETATQKDVEIYRHFDFQVMEEFTVPGTTLKLWAMLRQNQPPGQAF